MFIITKNWYEKLQHVFETPKYKELETFLDNEYKTKTIYPAPEKVFNALNLVKYNEVKVVIIGQDPYHNPKQAHGLSFSVEEDVNSPPSLINIYKELQNDLGCYIPNHGNLTKWAKQGILLLNSVLTVEKNKPNSHKGKGWENITEKIISLVSQKSEPVVFLLWGSNAISFASKIAKHHLVLTAPHPSPLSAYRGFFGCGHFKKCNDFLIFQGKAPIDWH